MNGWNFHRICQFPILTNCRQGLTSCPQDKRFPVISNYNIVKDADNEANNWNIKHICHSAASINQKNKQQNQETAETAGNCGKLRETAGNCGKLREGGNDEQLCKWVCQSGKFNWTGQFIKKHQIPMKTFELSGANLRSGARQHLGMTQFKHLKPAEERSNKLVNRVTQPKRRAPPAVSRSHPVA